MSAGSRPVYDNRDNDHVCAREDTVNKLILKMLGTIPWWVLYPGGGLLLLVTTAFLLFSLYIAYIHRKYSHIPSPKMSRWGHDILFLHVLVTSIGIGLFRTHAYITMPYGYCMYRHRLIHDDICVSYSGGSRIWGGGGGGGHRRGCGEVVGGAAPGRVREGALLPPS